MKASQNLDFYFFHWPDNQSDGDFELIVKGMLTENNKAIFDCIEAYLNCCRGLPGFKDKILKEKVIMCVNAIGKKEDKFSDPEVWKSVKEEATNGCLVELKKFFDQYFT